MATVFTPYTKQLNPARQALSTAHNDVALSMLDKLEHHYHDNLLYQAELGRIAAIAGDAKKSLKTYQQLIETLRASQLSAKVQFSKLSRQGLSLISNDNVIPYQFPGYETVLLYFYQSLNYLALHQTTDAFVSIKRADLEQRYIRSNLKADIADTKRAQKAYHIDADPRDLPALNPTYQLAKAASHSDENPLAYYFSSLFYGHAGDIDNAIVSVRKGLALLPHSQVLRLQLRQLLGKAHDQNLIKMLQSQYHLGPPIQLPADQAQLVVLYEQGLVPEKQQVSVPLLLDQFQNPQLLTLPVYPDNPLNTPTMMLQTNGTSYETEVLLNNQINAAKSLTERYPIIMVREAIRLITKASLAHHQDQKAADAEMTGNAKRSEAAAVLLKLLNVISAGADLRSWLTLPLSMQAVAIDLPPGVHHIQTQATGKVPVRFAPGETKIAWFIHIGDQWQVHWLNL